MKFLRLLFVLGVAPVAFGQSSPHFQPAPAETKESVAERQVPATSAKTESAQDNAAKPPAKISPEKEAAIRKLLETTNIRPAMEKVLANMVATMKPSMSQMLPPGEYQGKLLDLFFERFQSKLKIDDLFDLVVPVYDKYLTKEDIDGLTQFYQTPLGKKLVSTLPQITVETQSAAFNFGQEIGRKSMMEVLAEHPDLQKALEEASARKN